MRMTGPWVVAPSPGRTVGQTAPTRRALFGVVPLLLASPAWSRPPGDRPLRFLVFRNGAKVGEQLTTITRDGPRIEARTEVALTVRLGPFPVYRYAHHARELWRDDRFVELDTRTDSNGRREQVSARVSATGLIVETLAGRRTAPASAAPLSHWNPAAFAGPLFNPQTGRMLKVSVSRAIATRPPGVHWTVRGEAEIDDWYDATGDWLALRGRLSDHSLLEYHRV